MSAAAGPGSVTKNGFSHCGSELREARERLGWDLGEVAAALRIKLVYLAAIEDGRLSALPGNAYALGFLRSYATALGLDANDVTRRFRLESADVNRKPELSFPAPVPERGVPTGAAILVGLVVAVVAYGAWYRFSDHETAPARSVPPVPAQLLPERRAAAISPQVASVMPSTPVAPLASKAATVAPAGSADGGPAPASGGTAPSVAPVSPASDGAPADHSAGTPAASPSSAASSAAAGTPLTAHAATGGTPLPTTGVTPPPALPSGTVLVASAPTWIEVQTTDGKVLTDHVLQSGETWQAPDGVDGLLLTTGNAGGLAVSRNGVKGPVLGAAGAVLRRVPLDTATDARPASVGSATPPPPTEARPHAISARRPPPPSNDESADQLNARELGDRGASKH